MIKSKRLDFCSIILLDTTEPFNSKQAEWVIEPISKTAKTPLKEIPKQTKDIIVRIAVGTDNISNSGLPINDCFLLLVVITKLELSIKKDNSGKTIVIKLNNRIEGAESGDLPKINSPSTVNKINEISRVNKSTTDFLIFEKIL